MSLTLLDGLVDEILGEELISLGLELQLPDEPTSKTEFAVGAVYPTKSSFLKAYLRYKDSTHQPFSIRSSSNKTTGNQTLLIKCCHGIKQNKLLTDGSRPNQKCFFNGCEARINGTIHDGVYTTTTINNKHNHLVGPHVYQLYPVNRNHLTEKLKKEVLHALQMGSQPQSICIMMTL